MKRRPLALAVVCCFLAALTHASAQAHPTCLGLRATIVGTPGPDTLKGTDDRDVIVGVSGADVIRGAQGNDVLCGSAGQDTLDGGAGSDVLAGQEGDDLISDDKGNDEGVGGHGNDTINTGIGDDALFGGRGHDTLDSGDGTDLLLPEAGNDLVDGGISSAPPPHQSEDTLSFLFSPTGVHVDLGMGMASGEGADTIQNVENVQGSNFDDQLSGPAREVRGEDGDDVLSGVTRLAMGGSGNDQLAGTGDAEVTFVASRAPVTVDLASGTAAGEGNDTLSGFQQINGSNFDDMFFGDDRANRIIGWWGADRVFGRGGDDTLFGFNGYYLGDGLPNTADGGEGRDLCMGVQSSVDCEVPPPPVPFPGPLPIIVEPKMGQRIDHGALLRLRGEIYYTSSDPRTRLQIAIRRLHPDGCSWWSDSLQKLVPRGCLAPVWMAVPYGRGGGWSYRLAGPPPGEYRALARGVPSLNSGLEPGRNVIDFSLT